MRYGKTLARDDRRHIPDGYIGVVFYVIRHRAFAKIRIRSRLRYRFRPLSMEAQIAALKAVYCDADAYQDSYENTFLKAIIGPGKPFVGSVFRKSVRKK